LAEYSLNFDLPASMIFFAKQGPLSGHAREHFPETKIGQVFHFRKTQDRGLSVESSPNVSPMSIIGTSGVGLGHRDGGDCGLDSALHIKPPSKIALFEHLLN
jgi:hypothetical protein